MKTVSELVQETIDLMEKGLFDAAFQTAGAAFEATAEKASETGNYREIVDEYWRVISFMGFPHLTFSHLEIPIVIKEISPNPRSYSLKELVVFVLTDTLRNGKLPENVELTAVGGFEKRGGRLLIPTNLTFGLLGYAIFNPINKDEVISDKYWLNISSFKMFIAEFFGRIDLAERIVKFHLEN
ncbi:MAG: hypothetical protein LH472_13110 [Pyrinomonadaceae bacterium]|nr:hypothetical protein [Pyrinomonadaceae bacterium]